MNDKEVREQWTCREINAGLYRITFNGVDVGQIRNNTLHKELDAKTIAENICSAMNSPSKPSLSFTRISPQKICEICGNKICDKNTATCINYAFIERFPDAQLTTDLAAGESLKARIAELEASNDRLKDSLQQSEAELTFLKANEIKVEKMDSYIQEKDKEIARLEAQLKPVPDEEVEKTIAKIWCKACSDNPCESMELCEEGTRYVSHLSTLIQAREGKVAGEMLDKFHKEYICNGHGFISDDDRKWWQALKARYSPTQEREG